MPRQKKDNNQFKKEEEQVYRILVGSLVLGILNWLFWHEQFQNRDCRYQIIFVILPIIIGIGVLKIYFKSYVAYYLDTKNKIEKMGVILFLLVIGGLISFGSLGTMADVIFKSAFGMTADQQITIQKYPIKKFVLGTSHGRNSINRFSRIDYLENGKEESIKKRKHHSQ